MQKEVSAVVKKSGKIRYAVVGLGGIAQMAVLPAFKHAENSELAAIVSEDLVKQDAFRRDLFHRIYRKIPRRG